MAKPKKQGFLIQGFDASHIQQTEQYTQAIDMLYNNAVAEYAQMASRLKVDPDKPFSFKDYPGTKAKADIITSQLASKMQSVIVQGSEKQWLYACQKNDAFLAAILDTTKIKKSVLNKYQDRNLDALKTFQTRKVNGLGLSDRVWNYSGQMKKQMELGIDIALGDGKSAQALSRDLKQYLVDPDKLFRRVRDKHGTLHLSKNAEAFHPGQGKYRSSHKNALRLTRTEINMAYRESDQLRWKQLDFVVGFEVMLSNNHPVYDICDIVKGKYPKEFKFVGWHPQCRCKCVPVLMDPKEFDTDELNELSAAINGTEYKPFQSVNAVTDTPQGFKDWIADNAERSQGWKSQPYFIRDNFKGGKLSGGLDMATKPIIQQTAAKVATKVVNDIYSQVIEVENEIRMNKNFETAVAFDSKGNKVIDKRGQATSVSFTDQEVSLIKDTIFTHNHPRGWKADANSLRRLGNSFSPQDINMAIKGNVSEMRAVTPHYTFSMKRPAKGWPMTTTQLQKRFKEFDNEVRSYMYSLIQKASGSHADKLIERAEALHYHLVWKRFCNKYGIEYVKLKTRV